MNDSFFATWELFGTTYVTAWAAATLLAMVGIVVVARDQIFVGAAITQASLLGMGIALWLGYLPLLQHAQWVQSPHLATGLTMLFGVLTTLATMPRRDQRQTPEGLTGWIFLFATGLTIVLLAHSPVGMRQIDERIASSIIGATSTDMVIVLVAGAVLALTGAILRAPLILLLTDPAMARAVGMRVLRWETGCAVVLGLVAGFCLRSTGMLYTFGCLVLPGLAAKSLCRTMHGMLLVGPIIALTGAVVGFIIAHYLDLPPGPLTVVILALALPIARLFAKR